VKYTGLQTLAFRSSYTRWHKRRNTCVVMCAVWKLITFASILFAWSLPSLLFPSLIRYPCHFPFHPIFSYPYFLCLMTVCPRFANSSALLLHTEHTLPFHGLFGGFLIFFCNSFIYLFLYFVLCGVIDQAGYLSVFSQTLNYFVSYRIVLYDVSIIASVSYRLQLNYPDLS